MKSKATRLAIAGSAVNVELTMRLSYNEARALNWALKRIDGLTVGRVVTVPPQHGNCLGPALTRFGDQLFRAIQRAEPDVKRAGEIPAEPTPRRAGTRERPEVRGQRAET